MEEGGILEGKDPTHRWHIDPLDGTLNFLHGIPHFSISLGLEKDGAIIAGVVYDPIKDELFIAEKGKGAYVNNRRLRVSGRIDMADCVFGTGLPASAKRTLPAYLAELSAVTLNSDIHGKDYSLSASSIACGNETVHSSLVKILKSAQSSS